MASDVVNMHLNTPEGIKHRAKITGNRLKAFKIFIVEVFTVQKMPSLFMRVFEGKNIVKITQEVTPGCEWVLLGEGVATRKYDGTCCLIDKGEIYKRFDLKPGRKLPLNAIPCQKEADPITGHFPHWVKCDPADPSDQWHVKAFQANPDLEDSTYELCGVHFQKNIDNLTVDNDTLIKHGATTLEVERTFDGIKQFLEKNEIEGIVFHRGNGEMCKIKRSDFGFPWGNSKR